MKEQEKYRIYISSLLNPSGESGEEYRKLYNKVAVALEGTGKLIEVKNTSWRKRSKLGQQPELKNI